MASQPAISARTRVACVIGDPIAHSLSPAMHNAAFRHLGIDAVYVAYRITPAELAGAVAGFRAQGILGCNVTVPHKQAIVAHLDRISRTAAAAGAVNTIVPRQRRLLGENTDVAGFVRALAEAGVELRDRRVLLIGAGGAARAVLVALRDQRAAQVAIANRTVRRAAALARDFGGRTLPCTAVPLSEAVSERRAAEIDLVINASSIGLRDEPFLPLPYAAFPRHAVFNDLIPRARTALLRGARDARRTAVDGLGMLLHQGAEAFELWTGESAPIAVMRRALQRATGV